MNDAERAAWQFGEAEHERCLRVLSNLLRDYVKEELTPFVALALAHGGDDRQVWAAFADDLEQAAREVRRKAGI